MKELYGMACNTPRATFGIYINTRSVLGFSPACVTDYQSHDWCNKTVSISSNALSID